MKSFARMCAAVAALSVFAVAAPQSADAGLFHKKGAAEAACCPEPACEPVCAPVPVCPPAPVCPAPPVMVTFCVTDPCTCCSQEVSACVPAACACERPCLAGTRSGFLGRTILTYKWACGHCVEVVLTKHGKAIVRD